MEDKILVSISGIATTIDLLSDRIRINKGGNSTIEIQFASITSIKIEQGSLQIFTAAYSEAIAFPATRGEVFELFKLELERVINAPNSSLKDLVMLEKMGELKDKGFITEDEFNTKKQQILGQGIDPINVEGIKQAMESAIVAEEEKRDRQQRHRETVQNAKADRNKLGWRNLGIFVGCLFLLAGLVASATGCFVNGLFMLLTCLLLTPLIHHLVDGLSQGKINHVPAMVRVILVLVTMTLSTGSYYRYQSPSDLAAKAKAEQQRLDDEKMRKEQKEAEAVAQKEAQKRSLEDDKIASAKVEKLIELGFVSKIECLLEDTAYINPDQWASIDLDTKKDVTRILMDYCSRHGGSGERFTLKNEMDGKDLGGIGLFGFHVK